MNLNVVHLCCLGVKLSNARSLGRQIPPTGAGYGRLAFVTLMVSTLFHKSCVQVVTGAVSTTDERGVPAIALSGHALPALWLNLFRPSDR